MTKLRKKSGAIALAAVAAGVTCQPTYAQDSEAPAVADPSTQTMIVEDEEGIEEVVVRGRFISSSQSLVNEKLADAFSADLLGADTISRLGDSTVAAALRRVPGLTLVQDKYVYIRGLGERYTTSTLNGAMIPSPDLSRNVIPLDVFPTSVVESLRVQKSWAPGLSANFGGGAVDIRTKGIPDQLTVKFELGLGSNSENPSQMYTYDGGSDDNLGVDDGTRALSPSIQNGIVAYQGRPDVNTIFQTLQSQDPTTVLYDAQVENRELALALNRNISLKETSADPDYNARVSVGNNFLINKDWEAGFNVGASYGTDWRFRRTRTANFGLPDEQNGVREEATRSVNIAGTLNFGLNFIDEHEIATTSLFLRNTDDETEVFDYFNENRLASGNRGFRDYRLQFEEREMLTHQITGSHRLGAETRDRIAFLRPLIGWLPEDASIQWFYSTSEAQTDIPNQVEIASETFTNPATGEFSESVRLGSSAADFRFTELEDEVEHYGWSGTLPLTWKDMYVELSGGWDHAQKARIYGQTQLSLGFLNVSDQSVLEGSLGDVFSDANILADAPDPDPSNPIPGARIFLNDAQFDRRGTNSNSYLAATMTDSAWGQVDWTLDDTYRLAIGARWEDYRQVGIGWNPYGFSADDPQIAFDPDDPELSDLRNGTFKEDKVYPSAALTYMGDFWAETFQLRLGFSETAVRPDLREITNSSYIDPITGDLIRGRGNRSDVVDPFTGDVLIAGGPGLIPSQVTNIDLRAEWYFSSGDNLTITLFDKQIDNPIEFFEIPASDTTIAREVINADKGSVTGVEMEFLKELGFLGGPFDTLFVQGNLTLQDSELVAGPLADNPTNPVRELSGASEHVANLMIGFDSPNARHTASLIYNVFGERLYVAGRLGSPDGYEQPFHSLDLTYFWYPTDRMTLKFKAQNLLGETITIERAGITTFEEDPGTGISLSFAWQL